MISLLACFWAGETGAENLGFPINFWSVLHFSSSCWYFSLRDKVLLKFGRYGFSSEVVSFNEKKLELDKLSGLGERSEHFSCLWMTTTIKPLLNNSKKIKLTA